MVGGLLQTAVIGQPVSNVEWNIQHFAGPFFHPVHIGRNLLQGIVHRHIPQLTRQEHSHNKHRYQGDTAEGQKEFGPQAQVVHRGYDPSIHEKNRLHSFY
ncbi:hypothetical protein D3C75_933780 [compost metagenome]